MANELLLGLLEGLEIPSARGGRSGSSDILVIGSLGEKHLAEVLTPPQFESDTPALKRLTQRHHSLARMLSEGRTPTECSAITGHSLSRISILKHDPAFQELLAYYETQSKEIYINIHERLAALGEATVGELHDRLEEDPKSFSNKELRELSSMVLDRSSAPPKSGAGTGANRAGEGGAALALQINFVSPVNPAPQIEGEAKVIDVVRVDKAEPIR